MAVVTEVKAYGATIEAGVGVGNSASYTFTVFMTSQFSQNLPIKVFFPTSVSAGPQIYAYGSTDGGTNFATVPAQSIGIARQSGGNQQVNLKLDSGVWAVQVLVGGGSTATWTIQSLTSEILTSLLNQ